MSFERIKLLRNERGITREALADKLGISLSALGNYERGERVPDAALIVSLARFFGVTSDYLLELSDLPKNDPPWPPAVPANLVAEVNSIKSTVELMISTAVLSGFGIYTFKGYTEIFMTLPEIDAFATKKLVELQRDYPDFRRFGVESEMIFDGKPLLLALADGSENATEFAKKLTQAISEIKNKIFEIKENVDFILTSHILEAIQGRPIDNILR